MLEGLIQRRTRPDPATYIGRGKVAELREVVVATGADTVICDGELSPAQLRNLEDQVKVKVIDRTALILDIFASHAKSAEGKAQVELAQLQYLKQRLRGWGGNLSRQVGGRASGGVGIGGRGPGETKLETDRRRINSRIAKLRAGLREMDSTRETKRAERRRHQVPSVAIVGYTNAGKSSLLNQLTGAGVLVEDALFATLDPDHPAVQHGRRPGLHPDRHRRLRPAPAARPGRGVRLHPGGVGLRPTCCCTWWTAPIRTPTGQIRAVRGGARRHRRRRRAGAARDQQGRPGVRRGAGRAAHGVPGRRGGLGADRARASTGCGRWSRPGCRGRRSRCGHWCRTSGAT